MPTNNPNLVEVPEIQMEPIGGIFAMCSYSTRKGGF